LEAEEADEGEVSVIPRGVRNNNPGNIKKSKTKWLGKVDGEDTVFETFDTMDHGIRALTVILKTYILKYKLDTIPAIIKRFAPSIENATPKYIDFVCHYTGFDRNTIIFFDLEDMLPLVKAICRYENAGEYITNEQIEKAWEAL
jgi:hypothetical protein